MNDLIAALATRRSVAPANLSGPGPDEREVDSLLQVASRVPDHGKLAPWRFIVFAGEGRDRAGAVIEATFRADQPDAEPARLEGERRRLSLAPLVVGVISAAKPHAKIPEWEQIMSAGAVCMNLIVAANAMGFRAVWLTEWYAYDRRVLDAFGIEPHEKVAGFVHIGRATAVPSDRPRPALSDIVTRF